MPKFEVGEIAVGCNLVDDPSCNGMECEIVETLQITETIGWHDMTERTVMCHQVKWANGDKSCQPPYTLRKLPPADDHSTWEEMYKVTGYKPRELVEV